MLYCDFCGKSRDQVFLLVESPTAHICDQCVDLSVTIINERLAHKKALENGSYNYINQWNEERIKAYGDHTRSVEELRESEPRPPE